MLLSVSSFLRFCTSIDAKVLGALESKIETKQFGQICDWIKKHLGERLSLQDYRSIFLKPFEQIIIFIENSGMENSREAKLQEYHPSRVTCTWDCNFIRIHILPAASTLMLLLQDVFTSGKGGIDPFLGICAIITLFGVAESFIHGGITEDLVCMCPEFLQSFYAGFATSGFLTSCLRLTQLVLPISNLCNVGILIGKYRSPLVGSIRYSLVLIAMSLHLARGKMSSIAKMAELRVKKRSNRNDTRFSPRLSFKF
ncbi:Equilibrative nucleotide transporter 3 [Euphorbia peplus]|nr:Equilibrative nucleotide transporter 3 [Euphorbia peplus]